MNTVQKNNNITKKQVQELLENNQKKLGLSDKNLRKLIKSMRSHTISRQMRNGVKIDFGHESVEML